MSSSMLSLWNMNENDAQNLVSDIQKSGVFVPEHSDVHVRVLLATKNWCNQTGTNVVGSSLKILNDLDFIDRLTNSDLNHDDKLIFALYKSDESNDVDVLASDLSSLSIDPVSSNKDTNYLIQDRVYITDLGYQVEAITENLPVGLLKAFDLHLRPIDTSSQITQSEFPVLSQEQVSMLIKSFKLDKNTDIEKFLEHIKTFNSTKNSYLNLTTGRLVSYTAERAHNGTFFSIKNFPSMLTKDSINSKLTNDPYVSYLYSNNSTRFIFEGKTYSYHPQPGYKFYIPYGDKKVDYRMANILPNIFKIMIERGLVDILNTPSNQVDTPIRINLVTEKQLQSERYADMER